MAASGLPSTLALALTISCGLNSANARLTSGTAPGLHPPLSSAPNEPLEERSTKELLEEDEEARDIPPLETDADFETRANASTAAPPPVTTTTAEEGIFTKPIRYHINNWFAAIWLGLLASMPIVLAYVDYGKVTKVHTIQGLALLLVLGAGIYMFMNTIQFNSSRSGDSKWEGDKCLTLVEAVYLMGQVITTVGYGDIVPSHSGGQVVVAFYVLGALVLIAEMVSEVGSVVAAKAKERVVMSPAPLVPQRPEAPPDLAQVRSRSFSSDNLTNVKLVKEQVNIPYGKLGGAFLFYFVVAFVGILFYVYHPGEGKTWLEGVYMSVVTLSTVGFGAVTPTTSEGMVFGAYWMLIGVAALGNVISSASEVIMTMKEQELKEKDFEEALKLVKKDPQGRITRAEFLKLSVVASRIGTEDDIQRIEHQFEEEVKKRAGGLGPAGQFRAIGR